jgi:hypothetical protein
MHIRQKGQSIRLVFADTSKPQTVSYAAINTTSCWSATFNAWGKKVEAPLINIGGKVFKVTLEEIQ